jgi:fatty-acyl-CoA synthase
MISHSLWSASPNADESMKSRCPQRRTVPECIEQHIEADRNAHCCSIRVSGEWIAYSREEFWTLVRTYTNIFAHNCEPNEHVLFSKKLDIHLLTAYVGAMRAGCVPAMVTLPSSKSSLSEYKNRVSHIQNITKSKVLFTDFSEKDTHPDAGGVKQLTSQCLADAPNGSEPRQHATDALIQFSSGSTGLQKGVYITHEAVIAHMKCYGEAMRLTDADAIVSWLPLYHDMGLMACYLMPLMCGVPFYQMDPFEWIMQPDLLFQAIEKYRATICYLPNFAYHVMINKGRSHDLSSVRLWVNCSEPARASTHNSFYQKFESVQKDSISVCYALAENTFAVTQKFPWDPVDTPPDFVHSAISCGKKIAGVEVKIVAEDGQSFGEIAIRSPSLFRSFVGVENTFSDGYYLTGDLGYLKDDELYITGRKKDLIISNGKNIYPHDVESATTTVNGVYAGRCVAFGLWNEDVGSEELIVLVELHAGVDIGTVKVKVQKAIQEEVGVVPKRVFGLEHMSLVKTSSGKVSRSRNKEIYLDHGFRLI